VVNVPITAEKVCNSLPRTPSNAGIIAVKLKRKLNYKGYMCYKNIRPNAVKEALAKLKMTNKFYSQVEENEQWEDQCSAEDADTWQTLVGKSDVGDQTEELDQDQNTNIETSGDEGQGDTAELQTKEESQGESTASEPVSDQEDEEEDPVAQLRGIKFDSCVQPNDPALETEGVFSIAPGEGKRPISIMTDENCEEQSFPQLFPTGEFGFNVKRNVKLSPKKYFIGHLLNRDPRFAQNVEYLFFAQFITEQKQVMDNISIA
jgi:cobalamin biosynthesis protein CobT